MAIGFQGGFTVLIAVYAGDNCILFRKALQSIFTNSLQPTQTILVVDGVVPQEMHEIIEQFESRENLQVYHLAENLGLRRALNHGLAKIRTEWTIRADADDYNSPNRFQKMAEALADSLQEIDILGTAIQEVDTNGTEIAVRRTPLTHEEIIKFSRKRNPFNHMTVAFRTELAKKAGGYPDVYLKEDYALWAALLANGARAANLADKLVHATTGNAMYRRRGGIRYAMSEIKLQHHLVKCRLKRADEAILHGVLRSVIFIVPATVRAQLYLRFLRQPK